MVASPRHSLPQSRRALAAAAFALAALAAAPGANTCGLSFDDHTLSAGFAHTHDFSVIWPSPDHQFASGGVAAGDYDGDGFVDLFVVVGDVGPDLLYRNRGDGSFEEVGEAAGISRALATSAGPVFVDYDGDRVLDLLVPAVDVPPRLYRGRGDGTFEDDTLASGLWVSRPTLAAAFGDFDRDGDLDAYLSHWATDLSGGATEQLFRNLGGGRFEDATWLTGIAATLPAGSEVYPGLDLTFGPVFSDIDGDGWPDLLITGDFGTSQVLRNRRDGTFEDVTPAAIDDENGMGAAVGDFDNDCDLDWFVTSISGEEGSEGDGVFGISGNRLYRNDGRGGFEDATDEAGVRGGDWGWGACFADFDNDGHLDLFHTNGWYDSARYRTDASRLFLSNGDGTFTERAVEFGIEDRGMGRGVACFDAERDGDIDVFVANLQGPPAFYRNEAPAGHHSLTVVLEGPPGNTQGAGAKVYLKTRESTQMREIHVASRYASQDPAEAHFGLGTEARVLAVEVLWPDGRLSARGPLLADRVLRISYEADAVRGASERRLRSSLGCGSGR